MNVQQIADKAGVELLAFQNGIALCNTNRGFMPFVTWLYADDAFYSGNYAKTLDEAQTEFNERSWRK